VRVDVVGTGIRFLFIVFFSNMISTPCDDCMAYAQFTKDLTA
jgi:hypothetical protein